MTPFIALALVGGAAAAAFLYAHRNHISGQVKGALPGVVSSMTKGRTYAIMTTVAAQDGRSGHASIGTLKPEVASANIKNVYELAGFKVLAAPALRNEGEASDFLHKNPSIWLFNAQWTGDNGVTPPLPAAFILSQTFVTLPVQ